MASSRTGCNVGYVSPTEMNSFFGEVWLLVVLLDRPSLPRLSKSSSPTAALVSWQAAAMPASKRWDSTADRWDRLERCFQSRAKDLLIKLQITRYVNPTKSQHPDHWSQRSISPCLARQTTHRCAYVAFRVVILFDRRPPRWRRVRGDGPNGLQRPRVRPPSCRRGHPIM